MLYNFLNEGQIFSLYMKCLVQMVFNQLTDLSIKHSIPEKASFLIKIDCISTLLIIMGIDYFFPKMMLWFCFWKRVQVFCGFKY